MPKQAEKPKTRPNWLLSSLRPGSQARIMALGEVVPTAERTLIWEPGQPITHVYFPQAGCFSVITVVSATQEVEVGTVGWEGMVGLSLLHGVRTASTKCVVQVTGEALKIRAADFIEELSKHRDLLSVMHRYAQFWSDQSARCIACNGIHTIDQRCARWLLMTSDRIDSSLLPLRHEFLAAMLGVRRASVSVAAAGLQSRGLITYTRGRLRILDRVGLMKASCSCYSVITKAYHGLLPDPRRQQ